MKKRFIKTALKNMKTTGAIAQSSRFLIKAMLKHVDFSKDHQILELGAGHGNVTTAILQKMSKSSKLYAFEINDIFFKEVSSIKDDRFEVYHESAEHLENHIDTNSVDVVISALPLAMISKQMKHDIFISMKKVMKKDAIFIQYQYSLNDYKLIKKEFDSVNIKMTMLNLPPAFIYIGTNE